MKSALGFLTVALVMVAQGAHAENWSYLTDSGAYGHDSKVYIDRDSVARNGDRIQYRDKMTFVDDVTVEGVNGSFRTSVVYYDVACGTRQVTILRTVFSDAGGATIADDNETAGPFSAEKLGPVMDQELDSVCR